MDPTKTPPDLSSSGQRGRHSRGELDRRAVSSTKETVPPARSRSTSGYAMMSSSDVDPELAATYEVDPEDATAGELEQTPPLASWSRGRRRRVGAEDGAGELEQRTAPASWSTGRRRRDRDLAGRV
jgi:hypothetical protein